MKQIVFYIFLCLSISSFAGDKLRIGVITDTHFLSPKLMDDGEALKNYVQSSGRNVHAMPEVLDEVFNYYTSVKKIDVLFVCGDITKDGEKQSHINFAARLKELTDSSIKVYVIPGNHDINIPRPIAFEGGRVKDVPNVSPAQFEEIYRGCGYGDALKKDSNSLSYVAALDNDTWLLAIDAARYKEYTNHAITSGKINKLTQAWITDVLDEAKVKNKTVLGMMHWGLTEHIMHQSAMFPQYLVDDWQNLAELFADKGMKAIFTGHFHSNDISAYTSRKGNTIYDIETGTLTSYPFAYRYIEYDSSGMDITTNNVTSTPTFPRLGETSKNQMKEISTRLAAQKLKGIGFEETDLFLNRMADAVGTLFLLHASGDETMTDELRNEVLKLASDMDAPVDFGDLELDFPPADNNVHIKF